MDADRGWTLFDTPLGACGIAWADGRIIGARLPEASGELTGARLPGRFGPAAAPPAWVAAVVADVRAMLDGEARDAGRWPLDLSAAPELPRLAYAALLRLAPYGRTTTYGAIARELGDIRLSQAVGRAMGANPIPILVPCHRVLGADGKVGGFSGGTGAATKLAMLNIERAATGDAPGLFGTLPLGVKA